MTTGGVPIFQTRNPAQLAGANPSPAPRPIRVYTLTELDALDVVLGIVGRLDALQASLTAAAETGAEQG